MGSPRRSQNAQKSSELPGGQSFAGLEAVKNGVFSSTKYESQMVIMPKPHVFIFSNQAPNYSLFTKDRWRVEKIELTAEEKLVMQLKLARLQKDIDENLNSTPLSDL